MVPQNVPSLPGSSPPYLPPKVMEYLSLLAQNGLFPPPPNQTPALPAPPTSTPSMPPPSEGRSFTRIGRGQGGALLDKQKVLKEITASTRK